MKTRKAIAMLLAAGMFLALAGAAQADLITNGGFESNTGNNSTPAGWTKDFNSYGAYTGAAYTGSYGLHPGAGAGTGGEYQDITTVAGQTYDVSLWSQNFAGAAGSSHVKLLVGSAGTDTYAVDDFGKNTTKFSTTGLLDQTFATAGDGSWTNPTFQFTASGTATRFGVYNSYLTGDSQHSVNVDDVSVTVAQLQAPLVADLRADYVPGTNPGDTTAATNPSATGTGRWDYLALDEEGVAGSALLAWDPVDGVYENATDPHNDGSTANTGWNAWPLVGAANPVPNALQPAANELFVHPGDDNYTPSGQELALLRWTAGPGETGSITVAGTVRMLNTDTGASNDGVGLTILVDGVQNFQTSVAAGDTTGVPFNFNAAIGAGQAVDFIVDHGPAELLFTDSTGLSATIHLTITDGDIPEPATMAALGLALAGLGGYVRRRRKLA